MPSVRASRETVRFLRARGRARPPMRQTQCMPANAGKRRTTPCRRPREGDGRNHDQRRSPAAHLRGGADHPRGPGGREHGHEPRRGGDKGKARNRRGCCPRRDRLRHDAAPAALVAGVISGAPDARRLAGRDRALGTGIEATSVVPPPGRGPTESEPPSASSRSCRPISPPPPRMPAPPTPSSSTTRTRRAPSPASRTHAWFALACRLMFASASEAT